VRRGLVEGRRGRTIVKGNSFRWGGAFGRGRLPVCKEPRRVPRRCQGGRGKEATGGAGDGPLGAGVRGRGGLGGLLQPAPSARGFRRRPFTAAFLTRAPWQDENSNRPPRFPLP